MSPAKKEEGPTIDVAKHSLVPKHAKLSEKEKEKLLTSYNITQDQLPRIKLSDPAVAHLAVIEGDVVKISRHSETAGETDYYRLVVSM